MIRRFDLWLGKKLFVPVIILICQRAGISQWRFANYAFMLSSWLFIELATVLWVVVLAVVLALLRTLIAALIPDIEVKPDHYGWRALVLPVMAINAMGAQWGWLAMWVLHLAGSYARTIDTIPPREIEEPARKAAEARP